MEINLKNGQLTEQLIVDLSQSEKSLSKKFTNQIKYIET